MYPVIDNRGIVDMVAIQSYDITEWKHFEEKLEKEGISQIERNMEQFQILNDQIRNPLQVIMGYVSLGNCQFKSNIEEQIQIIDSIVTRLDSGWLESEKVRSFLFRHYQHGSDISNVSDQT
jgi:5,10-methylenetetrahydrofolate reductase